ncbi:p450 monooxygenase [Ilyonectria robusta]
MGFGHGMHSCPGRFFASNEAKVALCHLLMKYDFKLAPGEKPKVSQFGFTFEADAAVKVLIRRRKEEIELSAKVTEN